MKISEETKDKLVQYLEGELTSEKTKAVEQRIRDNASWREEYKRLKRCYLQPDGSRSYPWKNELKAATRSNRTLSRRELSTVTAMIVILLGVWAGWNISQNGFNATPNKNARSIAVIQLDKMPVKRRSASALLEETSFKPQNAKVIRFGKAVGNLPEAEAEVLYSNMRKFPLKFTREAAVERVNDGMNFAKAKTISAPQLLAVLPEKRTGPNKVSSHAKASKPDDNGLLKKLVLKVFNGKKTDLEPNKVEYQFKIAGGQHHINGKIGSDQFKISGNFKIN